MATTLQTIIDEASRYVKAELVTSGVPAVYDADSVIIVQKLISGINDAKNQIAMKKYPMYFTENITLDASSRFDTTDTAKTFYKLVKVVYGDAEVETLFLNSVITCDAPVSVAVAVTYQYIPDDMLKLKNLVSTDTDAAYVFPTVVDYRILCYKAAQIYYEINGGYSARAKAKIWANKYNEAMQTIRIATEDTETVTDVYNFNFDGIVW